MTNLTLITYLPAVICLLLSAFLRLKLAAYNLQLIAQSSPLKNATPSAPGNSRSLPAVVGLSLAKPPYHHPAARYFEVSPTCPPEFISGSDHCLKNQTENRITTPFSQLITYKARSLPDIFNTLNPLASLCLQLAAALASSHRS